MSFYDIVLDFIIMDSFDDLEEPPYALTSVIQNGWISNSIKETVGQHFVLLFLEYVEYM